MYLGKCIIIIQSELDLATLYGHLDERTSRQNGVCCRDDDETVDVLYFPAHYARHQLSTTTIHNTP